MACPKSELSYCDADYVADWTSGQSQFHTDRDCSESSWHATRHLVMRNDMRQTRPSGSRRGLWTIYGIPVSYPKSSFLLKCRHPVTRVATKTRHDNFWHEQLDECIEAGWPIARLFTLFRNSLQSAFHPAFRGRGGSSRVSRRNHGCDSGLVPVPALRDRAQGRGGGESGLSSSVGF